jgi:hypothetical protein
MLIKAQSLTEYLVLAIIASTIVVPLITPLFNQGSQIIVNSSPRENDVIPATVNESSQPNPIKPEPIPYSKFEQTPTFNPNSDTNPYSYKFNENKKCSICESLHRDIANSRNMLGISDNNNLSTTSDLKSGKGDTKNNSSSTCSICDSVHKEINAVNKEINSAMSSMGISIN